MSMAASRRSWPVWVATNKPVLLFGQVAGSRPAPGCQCDGLQHLSCHSVTPTLRHPGAGRDPASSVNQLTPSPRFSLEFKDLHTDPGNPVSFAPRCNKQRDHASQIVSIVHKALPPPGAASQAPTRRKAFVPKSLCFLFPGAMRSAQSLIFRRRCQRCFYQSFARSLYPATANRSWLLPRLQTRAQRRPWHPV